MLSPVRALRTGVFTFAPSGGVNRSAVDGTVSTSSALAVRSFTLAVMPGSSLPSSFETETTAV